MPKRVRHDIFNICVYVVSEPAHIVRRTTTVPKGRKELKMVADPKPSTNVSVARDYINRNEHADLLDFYVEVWRGIESLHHMALNITLELRSFPDLWVRQLSEWAETVTTYVPCEFYSGIQGCKLHTPLQVSLFNSREYGEKAVVLGWRLFVAALVDRHNDRKTLPIYVDANANPAVFTADVIRNKAIKVLCEVAKKRGYSREDIEAAVKAHR